MYFFSIRDISRQPHKWLADIWQIFHAVNCRATEETPTCGKSTGTYLGGCRSTISPPPTKCPSYLGSLTVLLQVQRSIPVNWNSPAAWCSKPLPSSHPTWPPSTNERGTPSFDPSPSNPCPTVATSEAGPFWEWEASTFLLLLQAQCAVWSC